MSLDPALLRAHTFAGQPTDVLGTEGREVGKEQDVMWPAGGIPVEAKWWKHLSLAAPIYTFLMLLLRSYLSSVGDHCCFSFELNFTWTTLGKKRHSEYFL
jgi:hypothetical protein